MTYKTHYFDTDAKKFFYDHHNGKVNREKIRMRKYMDSEICFLEIKQKDGKGKTHKSRITIPDFEMDLSKRSVDFIRKTTRKHYRLSPVLMNLFNRITLVDRNNSERVTVDLNLKIKNKNAERLFQNLVIIEVKQPGFNRESPIIKTLRKHHAYPCRISKYCIGMVCTLQNLKYNEFKEKLLKIKKLNRARNLSATTLKINPAMPVGA